MATKKSKSTSAGLKTGKKLEPCRSTKAEKGVELHRAREAFDPIFKLNGRPSHAPVWLHFLYHSLQRQPKCSAAVARPAAARHTSQIHWIAVVPRQLLTRSDFPQANQK